MKVVPLNTIANVQAWWATREQGEHERGAGLAEYALLLLLITIVTAVVINTMGDTISNIFGETNDCLNGNCAPTP